MTRSVRIQESGVSQDFSDVKTITTPVVGGGNATWMPEDETTVGEITITGNGEYVPSEHNLYGFYKVNVIVPGGGQGEYVSPGGIGVNIDGTIPMTQPDGTISNVRIGDGPYIPPPAGMGGTIDGVSVSGGTIAGIDPDTGDYVQYTVVDSDGVPTLSKTTPQSESRPASIRIINPPSQTTYAPGALINFSGIQVGVYDQNGNPFVAPAFTVDGHTYGPYDGTIPFSELSFPVKYASEPQMIQPGIQNSDLNYPVPYSMGSFYISYGNFMFMSTSASGNIMFIFVHNTLTGLKQIYACSKTPNSSVTSKRTNDITQETPQWAEMTQELDLSYTYDNKTVYYIGSSVGNITFTGQFASNPSECTGIDPSKEGYWALMYGKSSENNNIPIEWTSPYDGIAYGDHFSINVSDTPNDGYTGSGGGSF